MTEKPLKGPLSDGPDCNEALANMYLFLDRELPTENVAHVQSHLDDCIPCLEAFEFEAELKTVIASRCKDDVPEHLYARIRSSLKSEIETSGESLESPGKSQTDGIPNA